MTSTQINQGNYTAYQPYMLLNFDYSFQNDVLDDDLSVTILEVLGRINLNKFIDFHNLDSRSYDPVMMLTIILMAFAEDGYASRSEEHTSELHHEWISRMPSSA